MTLPRVLVVEDEPAILEGVAELFSLHDFAVETACDGRSASVRLSSGDRYALFVLDLMIPPPTGLELLTQLRARGDTTPVLVLTAKGAEEDIVEGLERGADDYVTKPFGIKALVARARGLLRRASPIDHAAPAPIALGGAVVDLAAARVTYGSHPPLSLSAREVSLLGFLLAHRDRVVTRAELLVHVWGYRDGNIETRTVDVHLVKLRRKLAAVPGGEHWIETNRGLGYRLVVT